MFTRLVLRAASSAARRTATLAIAVLAATMFTAAAPAAASGPSPTARCGGEQDLFSIEFTNPRTGATELYTRPVASHGGCVSSWARGIGELSGSALAAQCKRIEGILESRYGYAYPHAFYGLYPAKNRADCKDVMHGLSTGQLDSGLPTPFPF